MPALRVSAGGSRQTFGASPRVRDAFPQRMRLARRRSHALVRTGLSPFHSRADSSSSFCLEGGLRTGETINGRRVQNCKPVDSGQ
jgi:hypothetical protein